MRLGILLKIYRFKYDLTLRDLAKSIGISASTLSRLENGNAPDYVSLIKLFCWIFSPATDMKVQSDANSEATSV